MSCLQIQGFHNFIFFSYETKGIDRLLEYCGPSLFSEYLYSLFRHHIKYSCNFIIKELFNWFVDM